MCRNHHKSTIERIKKVRAIVNRYYESGNNSRCYKAVWRRYVNPLYPMSYRTFLSYLDIPTHHHPTTPHHWKSRFLTFGTKCQFITEKLRLHRNGAAFFFVFIRRGR